MKDAEAGRDETREQILRATLKLIAEKGVEATTTRAVATAAGVQAPTIYRLFGDKRGLLEAAAAHSVASYVSAKATRRTTTDPVDDLRQGWDRHVSFGLAHPGVFRVMRSETTSGEMSAALQQGESLLRDKVHQVARAGRLRVTEERAVTLLHATGVGVIEALLAQPLATRDLELSALAREAVIGSITSEPSPVQAGTRGAAITLRAALAELADLSHGERALMGELLERIARSTEPGAS